MTSPAQPERTPRLVWSGLAALMLLQLAVHVLPVWDQFVRSDGSLVLAGNDAYYHLRQARHSLEQFPHLLRWDDSSQYPAVLRNEAAGLYDLTLAGLAGLVAPLTGLSPERALLWVCLWFPPLCLTLILPTVFSLVRRFASPGLALVMTAWVVILPGDTYLRTVLGGCDHHVVEMLASVLCVRGWLGLVIAERRTPAAWWRPAWGAALPLALLQFTWLGASLYLPLFALTLAGQLVADVLAGAGARPVLNVAVRYWLAFLILTALPGAVWPDLVLKRDLWTGTLLGTGLLLALLPAVRWFFSTSRLHLAPAHRVLFAGGFVLGILMLVLAASPTLRSLAGYLIAPKSTIVEENVPVTLAFYFRVTSLAGILALLTPAAGVLTGAWRRPGWWSAVLPSLGFLALWCRTFDYGYLGALHAVLLCGLLCGTATGGSAPHRTAWWGRRTALIALTAALLLFIWPLRWTIPWWDSAWNRLSPEQAGWTEAAAWLRTRPPAPPEPSSTLPRGRAGVLSSWATGNLINAVALRPAVNSRYPDGPGMTPFFLTSETAVRAAPVNGSTVADAVRHVVVEPALLGDHLHSHLRTVGLDPARFVGRETLTPADGRRLTMPSLGRAYTGSFAYRLLVEDGRGLAHFRLVFESRQQALLYLRHDAARSRLEPRSLLLTDETQLADACEKLVRKLWREDEYDAYHGHLVPAVKIFEQVPGARLVGHARPGATVWFELPFHLQTSGRSGTYRQSTTVDSTGRFEFVVPYATEASASSDLRPDGAARVTCDDLAHPVSIPEAAVLTGAILSGPDFTLPSASPAEPPGLPAL